nr:hypothetical protein [uncultured Anaeromusa sp.]
MIQYVFAFNSEIPVKKRPTGVLAVGSKTRCRGCSRRTAAREGAAQGAQQTSEYLYHTVEA